MKRILGTLVMGAALFSSCGNDVENLYDPQAVALWKANEYARAFVRQFGEIDPNHTWDATNRSVMGRWAMVNANQWESELKLDVPDDISEKETNAVYDWFRTHPNPSASVALDWSCFFIQHVYGNTDKIFEKEQESTVISKMNKLRAGGDEVNNFNADYGEIMFMQQSGTSSFSYENSYDGNKEHFEYTIQCINGAYYVGFDFCTSPEANEYVEPDGYYYDWILKLTPAASARVIAEDLGVSDDFDFNDVVFDVWPYYDWTNGHKTVITIQAAGGTLPLKVAGKEVHELFGVEVNERINTGVGEPLAPVMFQIDGYVDYKDVVVSVNDAEAGEYVLKTECGEAPQKIYVPAHFQWTTERQSISDKYSKFASWVGNREVDWIE